MEKQENGTIINQNGNGAAAEQQPRKGLTKVIDTLRRKYDAVRYSKTGKLAAKVLTGATVLVTGKVCYDKGIAKGKASVTPTIVTIEKIPETEAPAETPAEEESAVEEA